MSAILLRYTGEPDHAARALEHLGEQDPARTFGRRDLGPREILGLRRGAGNGYLALLGSPPEDEIGSWLGPVVAAVARPRTVVQVDQTRERAVAMPLLRYLASAGPGAAGQILGAAGGVGAHTSLASALARAEPRERVSGEAPAAAVYLRASIDQTAAVGGSVTHTHEVIRALTELGIDVRATTTDSSIAQTAALDPDPPCEWQLVRGTRLLRGVPASAALAADIALVRAALPAAARADFIYQRHARFSMSGAVLSQITGKPLILEFNGSEGWMAEHWSPTPMASLIELCERAALACAALVIVVSESDRRLLMEHGLPAERLVLNPNGVNPAAFDRGGGAAVRRKLGIPADALVVCFVGSFGPWHGVPVLAEAFARLRKTHDRAHLLLVGTGDEVDEVTALLADTPAESVHHVGRVPPAEVSSYLDASDVLASPHVWRRGGGEFFGSPTKLFEYMAARKAIAASALGQIADVLEHERTALLVEPGDVGQLTDAIRRLLDDPALRERLADGARSAAVERHTWTRNAQRVLDNYARLPLGSTARQ